MVNGGSQASCTQLSHQCYGFPGSRYWFVPPGVGDEHKELWKWKADSVCAKAAFDQRLAGAQKASRKWDQTFLCVCLCIVSKLSWPQLFVWGTQISLSTGIPDWLEAFFEWETFALELLSPLNEQMQICKRLNDQTDLQFCIRLPVNSIQLSD